ncbi:hypothetical protein [Capnocytophaga leadbetteri]
MELKNFAVDYILAWFQSNRPEMDVRKDWAQNFYNEIKDQLMLSKSNDDRQALALSLDIFLKNNYTNPVNQICKEVLEEEEFKHKTAELKSIGFLYTEELEGLIKAVKSFDWYNNFVIDENLLENEEFRTKVREWVATFWNEL